MGAVFNGCRLAMEGSRSGSLSLIVIDSFGLWPSLSFNDLLRPSNVKGFGLVFLDELPSCSLVETSETSDLEGSEGADF